MQKQIFKKLTPEGERLANYFWPRVVGIAKDAEEQLGNGPIMLDFQLQVIEAWNLLRAAIADQHAAPYVAPELRRGHFLASGGAHSHYDENGNITQNERLSSDDT